MTSTWTKERPTKSGWWQWRAYPGARIVIILVAEDLSCASVGRNKNGDFYMTEVDHVDEVDGEWSSEPIEEPT